MTPGADGLSHPRVEQHPSLRARFARSLRFGRLLTGWGRLTRLIAGSPANGSFLVLNKAGWFLGDLRSTVDRQNYLLGGYEEEYILAFCAIFAQDRRKLLIDVGANVGTHAIAFAGFFDRVICFEPSKTVFGQLTTNIALNPACDIVPVNCGLGDTKDLILFYAVDNGNDGLGTFLAAEQYDQKLKPVGELPIERGDDILPSLIGPAATINAIKLDIQGFEPKALAGMRLILEKHRPITWVEISNGTQMAIAECGDFRSLFPYPVDIFAFETRRRFLFARTTLRKLVSIEGYSGDVIVCPVGWY